MKHPILILLLGLAPALARADGAAPVVPRVLPGGEPAASGPCGVRLMRAPAELVGAIEGRLVALSACGGRLDVWIVRSDDGLYVIARDELGRVRERLVPDAEVAAALIASWVEIDAAAPMTGAGLVTLSPRAPAVSPMRQPPISDLAAPPLVEVGDGLAPTEATGAIEVERTMGLTVFAGFTTDGMTSGGAVLDHDLWHHDGLSIAAMAVITRDVASSYYVVRWDDDFFKETGRWGAAALVELHRRFGTGRLRFTPSIAFGLGATRHEILTAAPVQTGVLAMPTIIGESTVGPRIVATAALGIRVATSLDLELTAGWMFSGYPAGDRGIDPSDQAIVGGIGLRHDR